MARLQLMPADAGTAVADCNWTKTLGDIASQGPGSAEKTFHFVLNDTILSDNRIPPWRMSREIARQRNTLPVPPELYGNPAADGFYEHFDRVPLNPPPAATEVEIELLYQSTSWEYIQFLYLGNEGQNEMLGDTGEHLLDAWYPVGDETTRMAEPHVMASLTHVVPEPGFAAMLAAGAVGLAIFGRFPRRRSQVESSLCSEPPRMPDASEGVEEGRACRPGVSRSRGGYSVASDWRRKQPLSGRDERRLVACAGRGPGGNPGACARGLYLAAEAASAAAGRCPPAGRVG